MSSGVAGGEDLSDAQRLNLAVARKVRLMLAETGERGRDIAALLGISPSSVARSLARDPDACRTWSWAEVVLLGEHWQLALEEFLPDGWCNG